MHGEGSIERGSDDRACGWACGACLRVRRTYVHVLPSVGRDLAAMDALHCCVKRVRSVDAVLLESFGACNVSSESAPARRHGAFNNTEFVLSRSWGELLTHSICSPLVQNILLKWGVLRFISCVLQHLLYLRCFRRRGSTSHGNVQQSAPSVRLCGVR